ncbi:MAG: hypothetical protein WDW38_007786 [Sanguina aurantia]
MAEVRMAEVRVGVKAGKEGATHDVQGLRAEEVAGMGLDQVVVGVVKKRSEREVEALEVMDLEMLLCQEVEKDWGVRVEGGDAAHKSEMGLVGVAA